MEIWIRSYNFIEALSEWLHEWLEDTYSWRWSSRGFSKGTRLGRVTFHKVRVTLSTN